MKSDVDKMKVTIILRNGSLHRPDTPNSQVVQFERYQLNIPLQPPAGSVTSFNRGSLTMPELLVKAKEFGGKTTEKGRVLIIEYHKRLVLPVGCLILCLLGLPLGLQAGPRRRAIGVPMGLAIFILYYILFTFGKMAAKDETLPIAPAMWSPNILFLILALLFIRQVSNERPLIPEKTSTAVAAFLKKILTPAVGRLQQAMVRLRRTISLRKAALPDSIGRQTRLLRPLRGDAKNRIFHFAECSDYTSRQCSLEFKNVEVALDSGFEPCEFCRTRVEHHRTATPAS
jgi:lipopolysaccharide export system permease protein